MLKIRMSSRPHGNLLARLHLVAGLGDGTRLQRRIVFPAATNSRSVDIPRALYLFSSGAYSTWNVAALQPPGAPIVEIESNELAEISIAYDYVVSNQFFCQR